MKYGLRTPRSATDSRPESPFTVQEIIDLYKIMHKIGGEKGIIRQSEFFVYTEKDREALRKCQELGYTYPEITTWIRASKSDFALVKERRY